MEKNEETIQVLNKLESLKSDLSEFWLEEKSKQLEDDTLITRVIKTLKSDWINKVIGYYANHRENSEYNSLDNEYKVQDLAYILLSSIIKDIQFENPQSKNLGALTYTRIDFSSEKQSLFIEIKHANEKHKAKKIEKEISEDIIKYGEGNSFNTLIIFIYCYDYQFTDPRGFEERFTGTFEVKESSINVFCIVKP